MAKQRIFLCSVLLTLLLISSGAVAANADPSLAYQAFQQGQFGQALQQWQTILPELEGSERIDTLLHMAEAHQALGQVQEAFTALEEAHTLAESSGDKLRQALVLAGLSDNALLSRQLEEARRYAEESVTIARQAGNATALATALNHQGNVIMAQQRYPDALRAYREGIALAEPDPALTITLLINAIHAHLANETAQEAMPLLKAALAKTQTLQNSYTKTYNLIALGYLAQRLESSLPAQSTLLTQWAYTSFSEALKLAETLGDVRAKSYATGHLGELYLTAQRYDDAERLLHQALFFAEQSEAPELLARWRWQFGRLLKAQGKIEAAKAAYRKALDQLQTIQPALVFGQRGYPQFFRETIGAIYLELAELLLHEASTATKGEQRRQRVLHQVRRIFPQEHVSA